MPNKKQPVDRWNHKVQVGAYKPKLSEILKEDEIEELEDQITALREGELEALEDQITALREGELEALEGQIKALKEGEIEALEGQISMLTENEFETLEDQIATLTKNEIEALEDHIMELRENTVTALKDQIMELRENEIEALEGQIKALKENEVKALEDQTEKYRDHIEPWLGALLQADHLNLLIGSGLTTAIAKHMGIENPISMSAPELEGEGSSAVQEMAKRNANSSGHTKPNIEHIIRVVIELIQGLQVVSMKPDDSDRFANQAKKLKCLWSEKLSAVLTTFFEGILETEKRIRCKLMKDTSEEESGQRLLGSFLLTFANRTATRERLHVFTTNYDRLIEFGADLLGLRIIDRFVGELEPVFRASRLGIDMHYNPPGIRGEPRHLEGVMRMTKLHGSIDWEHVSNARQRDQIVRVALPFGAAPDHSNAPTNAPDRLMIYPNPAKDIETVAYPYAELFRDFATAVCQPNTVLVTYGYGFGDDHINRILQDMLTIPSTHIVILSFDDAEGKIPKFYRRVGHDEQISLLIGSHFGDLQTLVDHYLPKPITDRINWTRVELLNRREPHGRKHADDNKSKNPPEDT